MRILVLHSRYGSGDASGENRVVDRECELLRSAGHDVRAWTPGAGDLHGRKLVRAAADAVYSHTAARRVRELVLEHRSEIVHCHNLFPGLSPAVVPAAADAGATVVMTLHNYRLLCLPATFVRDERPCEDCLGRFPWRGVVHRCYRDSAAASATLGASLTLHRVMRTLTQVQLFLAPSEFVRDKHLQAGLAPERIRTKANFVPAQNARKRRGDYFLYLGRLSPEKGISTLVAAHRPAFGRLLIAGDGPERARLEAHASRDVELVGTVRAERVPDLLAGARALLLPTRAYEGAPLAVLEAYAAGVPVIASRVGAVRELVEEGNSGVLVPPDDPRAWTEAMERLCDDAESLRLGEGARRLWEEHYTPEHGLGNLEAAYRAALARVTHSSEPKPLRLRHDRQLI
jgi:glycosyltransferase involved in cell wall biosynthesis